MASSCPGFGGDIFGQLHGNWVPARDKSDGRAAGRGGGRRLARVQGWAPLFSSLRQGNWGGIHLLLALVPAFCPGSLAGQQDLSIWLSRTSVARTERLQIGA